ncbi:MAG TPA: tetratricopeptide repeat protein [Syntrophales bacterium]|nr:tetratricopeptide repeat protein [Syntrophales bacterium]
MGRASRKKKAFPHEIEVAEGRLSETVKPAREPRTKSGLQRTTPRTTSLFLFTALLASIAVNFNALHNGFVFDDNFQIVMNPWIKNVKYLPDIFLKGVWSFLADPTLPTTTNYYRPLMYVIYMINYYVFGLAPWGFHLVNMLFHAGNTVLVFLIAIKLFKETPLSMPSSTVLPAFVAALFFATHPIHTEAVTWIAGLPDVAFTFFYLLSFYFYILFSAGLKRGYFLSILSFWVATLFKEPAITLLILLIAHDYLLGKWDKITFSHIRRYIPYVIVVGIYFLLRFLALRSFAPTEFYPGLGAYQFLINIFPLLKDYMISLFWPLDLNLWHSFQPISSLSEPKGVFSVIVTFIFIIVGIAAYMRNKKIFFCMILFIVPLLPAFYIKGIGGKPFAERYLYLPSVGFVILLAIFYSQLLQRIPRLRLAIIAGAALVVVLYSIQTIARNQIWKNDLILFTDTVKKSPDAEDPNGWLGFALMKAGRNDEAIEQFRKTLEINPNAVRCHGYLGSLLLKKGLPREAISHFQTFLSVNPNDLDARQELADAYIKVGMTDQAEAQRRILHKMNPNTVIAYVNQGTEFAKKGMVNEAIAQYEKALAIDPNCADAHYNLGSAYANSGRMDKAVEEFTAAVRLQPQFAFYHDSLGRAYKLKGFYEQAIEEFKTAIRLAPEEPTYRKNLDIVFGLKDSTEDSKHDSDTHKTQ